MNLGEMDLEGAAQAAAGNWTKFRCHSWCRANELDDADKWCVVFTHHRDSGLLDQSNAAAIEAELDTFTKGDDPDVVAESRAEYDEIIVRDRPDGNRTAGIGCDQESARSMGPPRTARRLAGNHSGPVHGPRSPRHGPPPRVDVGHDGMMPRNVRSGRGG